MMARWIRAISFFLTMLIVIPLSVYAQDGSYPFIGIYTENHSDVLDIIPSYCPFVGDLAKIEIWILCSPNENGILAAEFMVEYPANVIKETITENQDLINISLGTIDTGISVCFKECQTGWSWPYHQTLWVTSHEETTIRVVGHPDWQDIPQISNCLEGHPLESCLVGSLELNNLAYWSEIAHCAEPDEIVATKHSSWGVIKKLFIE